MTHPHLTQDKDEYIRLVDEEVKNSYGLDDGGDLCFHLVENGTIDWKAQSVATAARIVAQHLEQA